MNIPSLNSAPSPPDFELSLASRWRVWLGIALLTLLWHLALMLPPIDWAPVTAPDRINVNMVDASKIEAIKKQWKNQAKQLLVNPNSAQPKDQVEAPEDARFMSDRNRRVERETRARDAVTVPKPGQPHATPAAPSESSRQPKAPPRSRSIPSLSKLGIPWKFAPTPQEEQVRREQIDRSRNRAGRSYAEPEGGQQWLREKNLPESAENMLNTQESVYYSFYARLYQSIAPLWQSHIREVPQRRHVQEGEYTTIVDVVMDRQGNLLGVRRLQASGIEDFDQAVDTAWHKMSNFPNPPAGLLDERGEVHTGWTFTVLVGQGFNLESLPPERNY